jgi:hypothetical protein
VRLPARRPAGGAGQEPPEVTWPEPELADGAAEACRPPEPELELPELELLEPELLEPEPEPELPAVLAFFALPLPLLLPWDADEEDAAGWALAAVARLTAMPPPASTLAAPMAAVTARSRPWPRLRAASAARAVSWPVSTPGPPSAGRAAGRRCPARMAGPLLRGLCCGCGAPVDGGAAPAVLWTAVWMSRWKVEADGG